ncbi:F-box/LRR-repeat protein 25-like isoform X2 [Euphorbia lathyris]|uniref:F-box/LRR-repeat protein 25-like isoform X2 n=1 Tax=Euphorbia lathyris TaxID=212925 RepID=UPI0033134DF6
MSKEDRISALPDSLIQHILCFLPSTKEAIRTSVLSKSFYNQWTRLPILKFRSYRMSFKKFSKFMDNTLLLHDCSKIQKFHINTYFSILDPTPNLNAVIDFAIKKYVEELILELSFTSSLYRLPEFLFDNASLVKLHTHNCNFDVVSCVSWAHLKALSITDCIFPPDTIENILCGSPSLESLELTNIYEYHKYVIFSKSLKKLVLENVSTTAVQISCPNLEEWKLLSPLNACYGSISINSPFLIHATIDFERYYTHPCLMLKFGSKLIQTLSNLHIGNLSSLLRKNKSLTLDNPNFEEHPDEIASALHSFHELEKLVIKLPHYKSCQAESGAYRMDWVNKIRGVIASLLNFHLLQQVVVCSVYTEI